MKTYNIDGIRLISKAMEKKEVRRDHWNIFDLPQEVKGTDWVGVVAVVLAVVLLAYVTTH